MLNFLKRWSDDLRVLKEEKLEAARRNGFSEDVRRGWFEKLDSIIRNNNLSTRPHAIYNCDECGFNDETMRKINSFCRTLQFSI